MKRYLAILALGVSLFSIGCGSTGAPPLPTTYTIGGSVSGLTGTTGLVLQDNGGDNLTVKAGATTFNFATALASGSTYKVTVLTQPSSPVQNCVVTSGSGTANANVTSVSIACTTITIGGTISGLTGTGLVLQDNGGDNLTVKSGATTFTFATALASGAAYKVTILTQPSSPTQNCVVTNGSGTANAIVTTVSIACTTTYTIGGTISGLVGTGLVLQDNGLSNLTVEANATKFTFATALDAGASYKVTVLTQPSVPTQTCVVSSGSGTANANVTSVSIACTTVTYTVSGTITGLVGTGLVLQDNGANSLTLNAPATTFAFTAGVGEGLGYDVTVLTQPSTPLQNCVVTKGSGTSSVNVTDVLVTCTTAYTIGGTITGLTGTGLVLQDNSGDNLTVKANATTFTFATAIDIGASYKVTVLTQPSTPAQNCVVTNGSGTANASVTTVSIACTNAYTIGGAIAGLTGTGLVLQDNSGDNLTVKADATTFTFLTSLDAGASYKVTVLTEPSSPLQNCAVTGGSGTANGNVTNVLVTCTNAFTIGGTISGQTGKGLVLQDNSGDNLTVNAPATSFTFATPLDAGASYKVTALTASGNPPQNCVVTDGSGTANATVTSVVVTCTNINEWTWENGFKIDDQSGTYGTLGTGATTNLPGARYWGVNWIDAKGNFWLFGGFGFDSVGSGADLNDLWEGNYNSSGQWEWTWVAGDNVVAQGGTYGTMGTAASGNIPGARDSGVSWTDASGNFWLFGGHGYDSTRTPDNLNDLWEYSPTSGEWKWVSGSDVVDEKGTYGTQGTGATTNVPGARYSAVSWIDKSGNFWLFGGLGYDSTTSTPTYLNDLWEGNYNSSGQWIWTWVSGSNTSGVKGTYGSIGVGNSTNSPGARYLSTSWTDVQGNLWLFGGYGIDSIGHTADLSDLWEYNTTTGQWTWVGGPEEAAIEGNYGTFRVAGAGNLGVLGAGNVPVGNIPGSREGSVGWADSAGNFWLFGGVGIDSTNTAGELNDLWEYTPNLTNPTLSEWTWQSGADTVNQLGNYGTIGVAATTNVPGSRGGSPTWIDSSGNLWLFGGNGPLSGVNGSFSDLWKYAQ